MEDTGWVGFLSPSVLAEEAIAAADLLPGCAPCR
jgi:hypothetical protein